MENFPMTESYKFTCESDGSGLITTYDDLYCNGKITNQTIPTNFNCSNDESNNNCNGAIFEAIRYSDTSKEDIC